MPQGKETTRKLPKRPRPGYEFRHALHPDLFDQGQGTAEQGRRNKRDAVEPYMRAKRTGFRNDLSPVSTDFYTEERAAKRTKGRMRRR